MKKYIYILLVLFLSSSLFAAGQKTIVPDLSKAQIESGSFENGAVVFSQGKGSVSFDADFLRCRVYTLSVSAKGENVKGEAEISFLYKYAYVGEYRETFSVTEEKKNVLKKNYIKSPLRLDRTKVTVSFQGKGPVTVTGIEFNAFDVPDCYGYFISPQYGNIITDNISSIYFRYFSNHEEKGKEDGKISATFGIYDGDVKKAETKIKQVLPIGIISVKRPDLPYGKYTAKIEFFEDKNSLYSVTYPICVQADLSTEKLYIDENGRIIKEGQLFFLLGLSGNTEIISSEEAREVGINTFAGEKRDGFFSFENTEIFTPQNPENINVFKDEREKLPDKKIFTLLDSINFATFAITYSDYLGFSLNENIYDKIQAFFDDYGFYFPLINVIEADRENVFGNIWENLVQTQTGLIFNIKTKADFEKIKPCISFMSQYGNIFLSNQEPKSRVFGNVKNIIRKADKKEYIFIFETRGCETETDVFVPDKKMKVYAEGILQTCDTKDKTKYNFVLKPYQYMTIVAESGR